MAIDLDAIRAQQRELNMISDEVASTKRKLILYKDSLDAAWKSNEIKGIDNAVEDVVRRLNRLTKDLEDLGHDVMTAGDEIRQEEEAARRAAEEKRQREEAARRAEEERRQREEATKRMEEEERQEAARRAEEEEKARQEEVKKKEIEEAAAALRKVQQTVSKKIKSGGFWWWK